MKIPRGRIGYAERSLECPTAEVEVLAPCCDGEERRYTIV